MLPKDLWERVLEVLKPELNAETFELWLKQLEDAGPTVIK